MPHGGVIAPAADAAAASMPAQAGPVFELAHERAGLTGIAGHDQDGIVPGDRAGDLGEAGAIERDGEDLRLAGICLQDDQLLHLFEGSEELARGAAQRRFGRLRGARRIGDAGPLIGAVAARFTRPSSLISRESVACVTSNPRARRRRRSSSWLEIGSFRPLRR